MELASYCADVLVRNKDLPGELALFFFRRFFLSPKVRVVIQVTEMSQGVSTSDGMSDSRLIPGLRKFFFRQICSSDIRTVV